MRHRLAVEWERRLKAVFDEIDAELEAEYGDRYPLREGRPSPGTTSNAEWDGLFNLGASFSPGYGSEHGRGYIVQIQLATPRRIPPAAMEDMESRVVDLLEAKLPAAFPNRELRVERDGNVYKIIGDLRLGSA
jgi:hypothetical protein